MPHKRLSAPFYPQMSDDGIITNSDLGDDTIYVEIRPYPGAARGDYLFLYFGDLPPMFSIITDTTAWPIIYEIPADAVSDGIYLTYYTATDVAGNTTLSAVQYCLVFRNGNASLPPPVFTDAVSGVLTGTNIISQGGTYVYVPAYPDIAVDDVVTLITLVQDSGGEFLSDSQYSQQHTVTSGELTSGFSLFVPEHALIVTDSGTVFARYAVHSTSRDALSTLASASINISMDVLLPAPWLVDAPLDVLTGADVVLAGGVRAALSYPDMQAGDSIHIYLRGLTTAGIPAPVAPEMLPVVVDTAQAATKEVDVLFSPDIPLALIDGFLDCYYTVTRADSLRLSFIDHVQFVSTEENILPAPTFLSAEGGELYIETIQAEGGTPLSVAYDTMTTNDVVRVWVKGQDRDGIPVSGASYVTTHSVTAAEDVLNEWILMLPGAPLLAVGDGGKVFAEYLVYNEAQNTLSRSYISEVVMKNKAENDLQMVLTMNAPPTDLSVASYTAYNWGYLTGGAGMTVQIECSNNVIIQESGSQSYTLNLNESGHGTFRLYSSTAGVSSVVAFSVNNPTLIAAGNAVFKDYVRGEGDIFAIASTTGAPASGVIPCSVYFVTTPSPQITMGRIALMNGEAEIVGYPGQTSADIALSPDHSAEINLISQTVGRVDATVTLPESSPSVALVTMAFTQP